MSRDVDAFVRRRVPPEHRAIVTVVRKLMREHAPAAVEQIAYGMPTWRANKIFAFLSPSKTAITFGFTRGGEFDDRYGLLRGTGKRSRHLKLRSVADVNAVALRYYIRQAVRRDAQA